MLTDTPAAGRCIVCAWEGARTKRGPIPAHPVTWRGVHPRTSSRCKGPTFDRDIARAIGAAFYAAGRCPMPERRTLTATAPLGAHFYPATLYASAPSWARFLVIVHAPISGEYTQHDATDTRPEIRRTIAHYFADRSGAEEWARVCALALGAPGVRAEYAGYVTVSVMHRCMKRWEAMHRAMGPRSRSECAPESPIAYTAIDPGGVIVRFTEPDGYYDGYGNTPPRSAWDRSW